MAWASPKTYPPDESKLTTLKQLSEDNPGKIICIFPETTTTNGRGILPLSPCLLSAAGTTKIYPVNLRYTPQDITTPIPGGYLSWFWKLLHKPSHSMRVRIATKIYNSRTQDMPASSSPKKLVKSSTATGYDTNIFDQPTFKVNGGGQEDDWGAMKVDVPTSDGVSADERKLLDRVAEDLARLGRVKRVGLTVDEKIEFLKVWGSRKR